MKVNSYFFPFAIFLIASGCSSSQEKETVTLDSNTLPTDTVLERNSPAHLDLTKHQLFIDTTRNSKYFDQIREWKPHRFDIEGINRYLKEITQSFELEPVDLDSFPRQWISIHSMNGQYVSYNPINGIDRRFTLTDSSINEYSMEADVDAISKVLVRKNDELVLELKAIPQKRANQTCFIRIKQTRLPHLYALQFSDSSAFSENNFVQLITPLENLTKFNMVVSDAPTLVQSAVEFDKVRMVDVN